MNLFGLNISVSAIEKSKIRKMKIN